MPFEPQYPTSATIVLEGAIRLLKKGHCKEACARDKKDEIVRYTSTKAASWSLYGALYAAGEEVSDARHRDEVVRHLSGRVHGGLVRYNDASERLKEEVITLLQDVLKEVKECKKKRAAAKTAQKEEAE